MFSIPSIYFVERALTKDEFIFYLEEVRSVAAQYLKFLSRLYISGTITIVHDVNNWTAPCIVSHTTARQKHSHQLFPSLWQFLYRWQQKLLSKFCFYLKASKFWRHSVLTLKQGKMLEVFKISTQYFNALYMSIPVDRHVMCEVYKRSVKPNMYQNILLPVISLQRKPWNYF
jgi:hypothetical protein